MIRYVIAVKYVCACACQSRDTGYAYPKFFFRMGLQQKQCKTSTYHIVSVACTVRPGQLRALLLNPADTRALKFLQDVSIALY